MCRIYGSFFLAVELLILLLLLKNAESQTHVVHFLLEPEDLVADTNQSVLLHCAAQGVNEPKILWKKDGKLVQLSHGDPRRTILANGSFHISSFQNQDEGLYQCQAFDETGSILSRSANLESSKFQFVEEPEDISISQGQTAHFSCAMKGPLKSVVWLKNDGPLLLSSKSRFSILPSGSLELSDVELSDQGFYRCNVSGSTSNFLSRNARLTVVQNVYGDLPPKFTVTPKSQVVIFSRTVFFECSSTGEPKTKVYWLKDGASVDFNDSSRKFRRIGESSLQISDVQETDKGMYQCRAENREDSIDASAMLDVQVPPKLLTRTSHVYAHEKDDVELPCDVYASPSPVIQWYKNGDMIMEGDYFQITDKMHLKILGLVTSDSGMYQCFAQNTVGNTYSSIRLIVLKPGQAVPQGKKSFLSAKFLGAPKELRVTEVSSKSVVLVWNSPEPFRNETDLTYAIYYKEVDSDRERVLNMTVQGMKEVMVQDLLPNKMYMFRVVGYNKYGATQSSNLVSAKTNSELKIDMFEHPTITNAFAISSTKIYVKWFIPSAERRTRVIQSYKLYYMESADISDDVELSSSTFSVNESERQIRTKSVNASDILLEGLKVYTEYLIWVKVIGIGEQLASQIVRVTTFSDIPAGFPLNVSIDTISANELRNGIITGYKIKYKQRGKKKAETVTTDGNARVFTLSDLEVGFDYQIKISAVNVNGTGPFTEWSDWNSPYEDAGEDQVPDKPSSLHARSQASSITLTWTLPRTNIFVRGWNIGFGLGIPDVYNKIVDGKTRTYTIDNLKSNSDYVISLRAFNQRGDGIPIYENIRTKEGLSLDEKWVPVRLSPPVGLYTKVLSESSISLFWTDSYASENPNYFINRQYVVKYSVSSEDDLPISQYKYVNTSELTHTFNDLLPGTLYEFSVKLVKEKLSSEWSLTVRNSTLSSKMNITVSKPALRPQDVTLLALTNFEGRSSIIINWQPPDQVKDGVLKGYLIRYTTNPLLKEWMEESVPDDVLTHQVMNLTPETTYYFQMSVKTFIGRDSPTDTYSVTTPQAKQVEKPASKASDTGGSGKSNEVILYLLIALSLMFATASMVLCMYYRNKNLDGPDLSPKHSLKKPKNAEMNPPDLWIHHDRMELKIGRNSRHVETPIDSIPKSFPEAEEKVPLQNYSSLDKHYTNSYLVNDGLPPRQLQSQSLGRRRGNQIKMTLDAVVGQTPARELKSSTLNIPKSQGSPLNVPSVHQESSDARTYGSNASDASATSSQPNIGRCSMSNDFEVRERQDTLSRRSRSNLKSFAGPLPMTSQQNICPQGTTGSRQFGMGVVGVNPSSPLKRASAVPENSLDSANLNFTQKEPGLSKCFSAEDLSQEISNLEGLMKDLTAITASEFQC